MIQMKKNDLGKSVRFKLHANIYDSIQDSLCKSLRDNVQFNIRNKLHNSICFGLHDSLRIGLQNSLTVQTSKYSINEESNAKD